MRNVILNRNRTPWANTDTTASPEAFYEPRRNQQISIHELGGVEAFNDCTEHIGNLEELKREDGMGDVIAELKSLIRGHRVGYNSVGNGKLRVL